MKEKANILKKGAVTKGRFPQFFRNSPHFIRELLSNLEAAHAYYASNNDDYNDKKYEPNNNTRNKEGEKCLPI